MEEQLVTLLNQLTQIQAELLAIAFARFQNNTIENVNNHVENKRENVKVDAERYGQDTSMAEPAINDYEEALGGIQEQYSDEANLWIANSAEYQEKEVNKIPETYKLTKRLNEKIDEKEKNNIKKQIENNRKEILDYRKSANKSRDYVIDARDECNKEVNENAQDNSLVNVEKQNMFQKLFSKIKDKIGGKEKFNENVVQPLQQKARQIKEDVIPKVKDNIEKNVIPKLQELYSTGKEKINELNLKEKFNNLMEKARTGATTVISNFKENVMPVLSNAAEKTGEIVQGIVSSAAKTVESAIEAASER